MSVQDAGLRSVISNTVVLIKDVYQYHMPIDYSSLMDIKIAIIREGSIECDFEYGKDYDVIAEAKMLRLLQDVMPPPFTEGSKIQDGDMMFIYRETDFSFDANFNHGNITPEALNRLFRKVYFIAQELRARGVFTKKPDPVPSVLPDSQQRQHTLLGFDSSGRIILPRYTPDGDIATFIALKWQPAVQYLSGDLVQYAGRLFTAKQNNIGQTPPVNHETSEPIANEFWTPFVTHADGQIEELSAVLSNPVSPISIVNSRVEINGLLSNQYYDTGINLSDIQGDGGITITGLFTGRPSGTEIIYIRDLRSYDSVAVGDGIDTEAHIYDSALFPNIVFGEDSNNKLLIGSKIATMYEAKFIFRRLTHPLTNHATNGLPPISAEQDGYKLRAKTGQEYIAEWKPDNERITGFRFDNETGTLHALREGNTELSVIIPTEATKEGLISKRALEVSINNEEQDFQPVHDMATGEITPDPGYQNIETIRLNDIGNLAVFEDAEITHTVELEGIFNYEYPTQSGSPPIIHSISLVCGEEIRPLVFYTDFEKTEVLESIPGIGSPTLFTVLLSPNHQVANDCYIQATLENKGLTTSIETSLSNLKVTDKGILYDRIFRSIDNFTQSLIPDVQELKLRRTIQPEEIQKVAQTKLVHESNPITSTDVWYRFGGDVQTIGDISTYQKSTTFTVPDAGPLYVITITAEYNAHRDLHIEDTSDSSVQYPIDLIAAFSAGGTSYAVGQVDIAAAATVKAVFSTLVTTTEDKQRISALENKPDPVFYDPTADAKALLSKVSKVDGIKELDAKDAFNALGSVATLYPEEQSEPSDQINLYGGSDINRTGGSINAAGQLISPYYQFNGVDGAKTRLYGFSIPEYSGTTSERRILMFRNSANELFALSIINRGFGFKVLAIVRDVPEQAANTPHTVRSDLLTNRHTYSFSTHSFGVGTAFSFVKSDPQTPDDATDASVVYRFHITAQHATAGTDTQTVDIMTANNAASGSTTDSITFNILLPGPGGILTPSTATVNIRINVLEGVNSEIQIEVLGIDATGAAIVADSIITFTGEQIETFTSTESTPAHTETQVFNHVNSTIVAALQNSGQNDIILSMQELANKSYSITPILNGEILTTLNTRSTTAYNNVRLSGYSDIPIWRFFMIVYTQANLATPVTQMAEQYRGQHDLVAYGEAYFRDVGEGFHIDAPIYYPTGIRVTKQSHIASANAVQNLNDYSDHEVGTIVYFVWTGGDGSHTHKFRGNHTINGISANRFVGIGEGELILEYRGSNTWITANGKYVVWDKGNFDFTTTQIRDDSDGPAPLNIPEYTANLIFTRYADDTGEWFADYPVRNIASSNQGINLADILDFRTTHGSFLPTLLGYAIIPNSTTKPRHRVRVRFGWTGGDGSHTYYVFQRNPWAGYTDCAINNIRIGANFYEGSVVRSTKWIGIGIGGLDVELTSVVDGCAHLESIGGAGVIFDSIDWSSPKEVRFANGKKLTGQTNW